MDLLKIIAQASHEQLQSLTRELWLHLTPSAKQAVLSTPAVANLALDQSILHVLKAELNKAKAQAAPTPKILEIDMSQVVPNCSKDCLEWRWVRDLADFYNVKNNLGNVAEFMVYVDRIDAASIPVPPSLRKVYKEALSQGCEWILFYQNS